MTLTSSVGRKLGLLITGVLTIAFVAATIWFDKYVHSNLETLLHRQAHLLHQQIVITRHWNASYGGVYVRMRPGMETNPYLSKVGPGNGRPSKVVPEIIDSHGDRYTLKNPALMSRELSELTARNADIRFHLTSLKLINPHNEPDDFEKRSLERFESGLKETSEISVDDGKSYYRFMAPLYIEEVCLGCHGFQGYKVGDVRGGISVTVPMDRELEILQTSRNHFLIGAGLVLVLVIAAIILGSRYLVTRPLRIMQQYASNLGSAQDLGGELQARHDEVGLLARELTLANTALLEQREQTTQRTRQLEHDSHTDALTGLCNRRFLFGQGMRAYERWHRNHSCIAILMLDIDHFKTINDRFGHQAGDDVLAEIARRLKQQLRANDLAARYGGEEFVVMLEAPTPGTGISSAQRIRESIIERPIRHGDSESRITVSIGVVEGNSLGDFEAALRKADEALYEAKAAGRNRIITHTENEL